MRYRFRADSVLAVARPISQIRALVTHNLRRGRDPISPERALVEETVSTHVATFRPTSYRDEV